MKTVCWEKRNDEIVKERGELSVEESRKRARSKKKWWEVIRVDMRACTWVIEEMVLDREAKRPEGENMSSRSHLRGIKKKLNEKKDGKIKNKK